MVLRLKLKANSDTKLGPNIAVQDVSDQRQDKKKQKNASGFKLNLPGKSDPKPKRNTKDEN